MTSRPRSVVRRVTTTSTTTLSNWLLVVVVLAITATAVNLMGQSFGLWDRPTKTVTIICSYDAQGKPRCMSEPIKVER